MIRIAILFCLVSLSFDLFGQMDLGIMNLRNVWQKNLVNPAHLPDERLTIALPSPTLGFHHSGNPFDEVWYVENETLVLDTRRWLDNLDEQNDFVGRFELPTIHVAWRENNWSFSVGHRFVNQVSGQYSKSIIELVHEGNASAIGDTILMNASMGWQSYSAFDFGLAWSIEDLTIGGRVSFLNGIQLLDTESGDVDLYTDDDVYQMTFLTDVRFRTSSFISSTDLSALNFEFTGLDALKAFSDNRGFSFDLGASYNVTDEIKLEMSILDVGFITWDELETYASEGEFEFDGVEVDDIGNFDTLSFDEALDTLGRIFDFQEGTESDFRQKLTSRLYIGGHWQVTPKVAVTAIYSNASFRDEVHHAFGVGGHVQLFDIWEMGTLVSRRFDNWGVGLNTSIKLGFVELFFTSDNIISVFGLTDLGNGNARLGLNLVFGDPDTTRDIE